MPMALVVTLHYLKHTVHIFGFFKKNVALDHRILFVIEQNGTETSKNGTIVTDGGRHGCGYTFESQCCVK